MNIPVRQFSNCYESLSPSEILVVRAILAGHTDYKAIGEIMNVKPRTVGSFLHRIFDKLMVVNKTELCLYVLRMGWFDCYGNTLG